MDDDPCSSEMRTKEVLLRRFLQPLRSLSSLTSSIRERSRELQRQARANASADWDLLELPPADDEDDVDRSSDSGSGSRSGSTKKKKGNSNLRILKSEAISSNAVFYEDIDPNVLRKRQFIELTHR